MLSQRNEMCGLAHLEWACRGVCGDIPEDADPCNDISKASWRARADEMTHLMEMLSTPLCSVFARVTIEYCEIALAPDTCKVDYKRICVFHRPSLTFVVMYTNLVGRIVGEMLIKGLEVKSVLAYKVGLWSAALKYFCEPPEYYRSVSV